MLFANVYRCIGSSKWLRSYAGLSFEYGNVFQARSAIRLDAGIPAGSAFLGLDSPIGPIYLAYGLAEGGRRKLYFFLGEPLALRREGVQRW